ncbi:MAG: thermonuclease family protein, partial [Alphaproteobacteria bacterium]
MKPVLVLILFFAFMASPLLATDIDFYLGLDWIEAEPGQELRLLGIYPSDLPEGVENYKILAPKKNPLTRHGALLSHVILENDTWLQGKLVEDGKAMVMPVYELDRGRLYTLKNIEIGARMARRGLWAKKPVVCAWGAKSAFDSFSIIQGQITEAANVRGTIYLNFGEDYRDDFTVKITRANFKTLTEDTQNKLTRLTETPEPDMVPKLDMIIEA